MIDAVLARATMIQWELMNQFISPISNLRQLQQRSTDKKPVENEANLSGRRQLVEARAVIACKFLGSFLYRIRSNPCQWEKESKKQAVLCIVGVARAQMKQDRNGCHHDINRLCVCLFNHKRGLPHHGFCSFSTIVRSSRWTRHPDTIDSITDTLFWKERWDIEPRSSTTRTSQNAKVLS